MPCPTYPNRESRSTAKWRGRRSRKKGLRPKALSCCRRSSARSFIDTAKSFARAWRMRKVRERAAEMTAWMSGCPRAGRAGKCGGDAMRGARSQSVGSGRKRKKEKRGSAALLWSLLCFVGFAAVSRSRAGGSRRRRRCRARSTPCRRGRRPRRRRGSALRRRSGALRGRSR